MMHHKRKGPKSTRAGCLLCKPHKRQGTPLKDRQRHSAWKAMDSDLAPLEGSYRRYGSIYPIGEGIEAPTD